MEKVDPNEKMILIVDDEPSIVQLLKIILEKEGFRTCSTEDARGISKMVTNEKVDLIIFDLMMPYMGGYEGIRQLQQQPETKNIPIVIVTGKNMNKSTKDLMMMEPNVIEMFFKPVDKNSLTRFIHQKLNTITSEEKIIEDYRKNFPEPK